MNNTPQRLFYQKFGNGPKHLIFFHGFGQTHDVFIPWVEKLNDEYTVFSFDLYYHGASTRPDQPLTKKAWKAAFEAFLITENIDQFAIGAYSLGGRFALVTAMLFPERVKHLILAAPDGVFKSPYYRLAVHPLANRLFKYLMLHPHHFNLLVSWIQKLGFASSSMVRFAEKELSGKDNRKRVYRSWTYFKPLQCHPDQLASVFNEHQLPVDLILGEYDPIIPAHVVAPKLSGIQTLNVHLLPAKHHQLISASKSLVASLLSSQNL